MTSRGSPTAELTTRTLAPSHPRTDAPLPAHVERGTSAFRRINLAVFSAGFSVFLLMYAVQPLLPVFAREFHVSPTTSSLALSLTTACLAFSMLVIGAIGEGWSRKSVMSFSLLAAAILTLLSSVVREWPMFLLIRAIEGVTIAGLPALAMAYLGEEIHPDALGISMGIYVGSGALGGMTGRLLTDWFGDGRLTEYGVRFVKQAWPGDTLTATGVVEAVRTEGDSAVADVAVSTKNQDGDEVLSGRATVRLDA